MCTCDDGRSVNDMRRDEEGMLAINRAQTAPGTKIGGRCTEQLAMQGRPRLGPLSALARLQPSR